MNVREERLWTAKTGQLIRSRFTHHPQGECSLLLRVALVFVLSRNPQLPLCCVVHGVACVQGGRQCRYDQQWQLSALLCRGVKGTFWATPEREELGGKGLTARGTSVPISCSC